MSDQSMDALIAEYIAGSLSKPAKVLVDAHMELSAENHSWARQLEAAAGQELDMTEPETLNDHKKMLNAIFDSNEIQPAQEARKPDYSDARDTWMPVAVRQLMKLDPENVPWRRRIPGVRIYKMENVTDGEVLLLRVKPGVAIPTHTHEGRELTLVLKGAFDDGAGLYERGDISIADEAVDHKPVAGAHEECICLVVTDAPVRFTGPVARVLSSLLPN